MGRPLIALRVWASHTGLSGRPRRANSTLLNKTGGLEKLQPCRHHEDTLPADGGKRENTGGRTKPGRPLCQHGAQRSFGKAAKPSAESVLIDPAQGAGVLEGCGSSSRNRYFGTERGVLLCIPIPTHASTARQTLGGGTQACDGQVRACRVPPRSTRLLGRQS